MCKEKQVPFELSIQRFHQCHWPSPCTVEGDQEREAKDSRAEDYLKGATGDENHQSRPHGHFTHSVKDGIQKGVRSNSLPKATSIAPNRMTQSPIPVIELGLIPRSARVRPGVLRMETTCSRTLRSNMTMAMFLFSGNLYIAYCLPRV